MRKFTPGEIRAVQEIVGLPPRPARGRSSEKTSGSEKTSAIIEDIQQALNLPEPRHRQVPASDRWLAGGSILRWIFLESVGRGKEQRGDYDFFFPSIDALNAAAHDLLRQGFTFRAFWARRTLCQLCGRPGRMVRRDEVDDLTIPLPRVECRKCGEFGGIDAATLTPDRLLKLTSEIISASQVKALELASPERDIFHLSAAGIHPTPHEVIGRFNFSLTQFAFDDRQIYFGPHTWSDILHGRFRLVEYPVHINSVGRLHKYIRMGFRPHARSVFDIFWALVTLKIQRNDVGMS